MPNLTFYSLKIGDIPRNRLQLVLPWNLLKKLSEDSLRTTGVKISQGTSETLFPYSYRELNIRGFPKPEIRYFMDIAGIWANLIDHKIVRNSNIWHINSDWKHFGDMLPKVYGTYEQKIMGWTSILLLFFLFFFFYLYLGVFFVFQRKSNLL